MARCSQEQVQFQTFCGCKNPRTPLPSLSIMSYQRTYPRRLSCKRHRIMSLKRILSLLMHSATSLAFSLGARGRFSHHEQYLFAPSPRSKLMEELTETPSKLFNSILCILILATILFKIVERWTRRIMTANTAKQKQTPTGHKVSPSSLLDCLLAH